MVSALIWVPEDFPFVAFLLLHQRGTSSPVLCMLQCDIFYFPLSRMPCLRLIGGTVELVITHTVIMQFIVMHSFWH